MQPIVHDYVIIGAGTAGCVLAGRLSENPNVQVLVIEAGMDVPPGREPKSIRNPFPSSYGDPRFIWTNLVAEVGADPGNGKPRFSRPFAQGRLVGGSSNIMGMMAQRGLKEDYDGWQRLGAVGWGWEDVLPFFRRLENDWDFDGPEHGQQGPIPIRRHSRSEWPNFTRAFTEAAELLGHEYHPDVNAYFGDCTTSVPMNNTPTQRVTAAMGYLNEAVRKRPNLTIMADATVDRIAFEQNRATAVLVRHADQSTQYRGREFLVCAGAIHSPAILLRSGVGPAAALRAAGVTLVADRPGVGVNLANHAAAHIAVHLPRHSVQGHSLASWVFSMVRYSSKIPGCPAGDMQLFPFNRSARHPLGRRIGALAICVYRPFSTGTVSLRDNDWRSPPVVKFNLLDDPRDFERLVDGVAKAARILKAVQSQGAIHEAFVPPGGQANALNRPTLLNWLKSWVINAVLLIPALRARLLRKSLVDLDRLAMDRAYCASLARRIAAPVHHPTGTCRMGARDDALAVVGPDCRVHGLQGLRVVDASIMPAIISANTHLAAIMIGEKASQMIKDAAADTQGVGQGLAQLP